MTAFSERSRLIRSTCWGFRENAQGLLPTTLV